MSEPSPLLGRTLDSAPTEFHVHRAINAGTDCEYPYLALPDDASVLLSLGGGGLCFELVLPSETERWLTRDFAPTGESLSVELASFRYLLDRTFASGVEFGIIHFDDDLRMLDLELSLRDSETAEEGPEYTIRAFGDYERLYRESEQRRPVTLAEAAMLDMCCATFAPLAVQLPHLIACPTPLRYRRPLPRRGILIS